MNYGIFHELKILYTDNSKLLEENNILKQDLKQANLNIEELKLQLNASSSLDSMNEAGLFEVDKLKYIDRSNFYNIVYLSKSDSINMQDKIVFNEYLYAYGKVIEDNGTFVTVLPFASYKNKVEGKLNNSIIKLTGAGNGLFELELPRDVELEIGSDIMLNDIENIKIGKVIEKKLNDNELTDIYYVQGVKYNPANDLYVIK